VTSKIREKGYGKLSNYGEGPAPALSPMRGGEDVYELGPIGAGMPPLWASDLQPGARYLGIYVHQHGLYYRHIYFGHVVGGSQQPMGWPYLGGLRCVSFLPDYLALSKGFRNRPGLSR